MPSKEAASLHVRVTPNASRNEVMGYAEGVLRVKVTARPIKGAANKGLIDFLSEALGVRKSQIGIVRGEASRDKVLTIEGLTPAELESRLSRTGTQGRLV